ncbi:MAG: 3-hydroxyacyl-ACP dehydratase FabZ [Nitrospinae bacterium]|nr:3-hydroxyacyl-ACP dehydratase FabZ [Nitrospinota bacterium]
MIYGTEEIHRAIPHRPPFLFVDRVLEVDDKHIVAEKFLSPDLDFFKGHYPHFPVMPGVLTCESIFQAGAILLSQQGGMMESGSVPVLARIRDARFKRLVRPGDMVALTVELEDKVGMAFFMKGKATVNGELAVSVSFTCALAKTPEPMGA